MTAAKASGGMSSTREGLGLSVVAAAGSSTSMYEAW